MTAPSGRPPLHVWDSGEGEPAIVFLHHFGGSGRTWSEVIGHLETEARCIAFDLRGFGLFQQGKDDAASLSEHAEDVLAGLARLDVGRFTLVGHSMGAKIAWVVAASRPAGLESVLLVAPSPPTPEPMTDNVRQKLLDAFGDSEAAVCAARKNSGRALRPDQLDRLVSDSLATSAAAWRGWLSEGSRADISDLRWPEGVPALVISGLEDSAIPTEVTRREVQARIVGAGLETVAGAGHLLPLEIPAMLAARVAEMRAAVWRPQPAGERGGGPAAGEDAGPPTKGVATLSSGVCRPASAPRNLPPT